MRNTSAKNKQRSYINTIGLSIALIIAAAALWFFFWRPAPTYPLGDRLEYIGELGYGCVVVCDARPTRVYYYSTDMGFDELISYFKKAKLVNKSSPQEGVIDFGIQTPTGETVHTYYYENLGKLDDGNKKYLKQTTMQHILEVMDSKYEAVKASL